MKIVLAIDGSKFSEAAIQAVATQIHSQDVQVLIVHIIEPAAFFEQDAGLRERSAQAQTMVASAARTLQAAGFQNIDSRVVDAEIRTGILDVATHWQADLIVLGSHGRKGLQKLMLGSVAEAVARHASCSVFIVRIPSSR